MTLEEAKKVKESLEELSISEERFSWGPSYEFAEERKKEALKIINAEIRRLNNERNNP